MRRMMLAMRVCAVVLLTVGGSSCATPLSLNTAIRCAALIPPSLSVPVPDVPPPDDNTVGGWVAVADARSGRLDEANSRTAFVIESATACQAESDRLQRKPWRAVFGG